MGRESQAAGEGEGGGRTPRKRWQRAEHLPYSGRHPQAACDHRTTAPVSRETVVFGRILRACRQKRKHSAKVFGDHCLLSLPLTCLPAEDAAAHFSYLSKSVLYTPIYTCEAVWVQPVCALTMGGLILYVVPGFFLF